MVEHSAMMDYLAKIKRIINVPDFNFFGNSIVNKSQIDDLWCCLLATLPKLYKENMKSKLQIKAYPSMMALDQISIELRNKFLLMPKYYFINKENAVNNIKIFESEILNDIHKLEAA